MTVEEIMEAEAAEGNAAAANFDSTILNDPTKLIELFKLDNVGNKYAILSNMNENDLDKLLPLLNEDDLVMGLNFFNKDQLLKLIEYLPQEQLINMVFQMFSPEQLMQLMPEDQLNKVLTSTDLDRNMVLQFLPSLKPEILAQMYEGATGQMAPESGSGVGLEGSQNYNSAQLIQSITDLSDDKFQEALLSIPPANKQFFVLQLAKNNPKLYQSIDASAYTDIIKHEKDKEDLVRASNVIDKNQLVKMVVKLPKDLLSIVLTQIDPKQFADMLLANFKDIIGQIMAG